MINVSEVGQQSLYLRDVMQTLGFSTSRVTFCPITCLVFSSQICKQYAYNLCHI